MPEPSSELVDLLTDSAEASHEDKLYELVNTISNIVSSYDDPYDAFAELVQNGLDAVAARAELEGASFQPRLRVEVDIDARKLVVRDNGTGIQWEHRRAAVRPNYSLKRRLGQRSSRGEKGAALAFLQFGHAEFALETRSQDEHGWSYRVSEGRNWFEETVRLLEDDRPFEQKRADFPTSDFDLSEVSETQFETEVGTSATVVFPDDRLRDLLGEDQAVAFQRLEYILRTRTGIGFMIPDGDRDELTGWQATLRIEIKNGTQERTLTPGFLYPHELAKRNGPRKSSLLTSGSVNNELLYEWFDKKWIKKYLPRIAGSARHMAVIDRFEVCGYVAYAHRNNWYEEVTQCHLSLPEDSEDSALAEALIQVNGGFLVAVRDFPTGRRKSFLHRSGAEHKSRTFVCLNLSGDYKPDYGRKNLSAEAHALVLDICKDLISFAAGKSAQLYRSKSQSTHSAKDKAGAEEALKENARLLKGRGLLVVSGESTLRRAPATETEVVAEFLKLVAMDALPGFQVYGLLARGMLDGYFDYALPVGKGAYDPTVNPLGVGFPEGMAVSFEGQWMEFKITSDALTDDFKRKPGEAGKKYFGLVDLLVCESVDSATDDFDILALDEENYDQRKFFGVTHLLRSAGNDEHQVQVICLRTVREILTGQGLEDVELRNVEPVEEG
ncbi:hypothetical protein GCM10027517_28860 [Phycicoccus ginsengisoli]